MTQRTAVEQQLVDVVWAHYQQSGRHDLPWRHTTDPYRIVVSEVMLQQTQVARVVPKYRAFLQQFPSTRRLAEAPLGEVLGLWQGLGYNRRAKLLQHAAVAVRKRYYGRWPKTERELLNLPGIGIYTARAVLAFAYNTSTLLLETNIKTVLLVHLFPGDYMVSETALYQELARIEDTSCPREWYWALMDYGAWLKQVHPHVHRRVQGYRRQSTFRGSDREIRGAIVRWLHQQGSATTSDLVQNLLFDKSRVIVQLEALKKEGLVMCESKTKRWQLPDN